MAISRKPHYKSLAEFIAKAEVDRTENEKSEANAVQVVTLRVPKDLLKEIDETVGNRKPPISRHQWLMEAIYAYLE